MVEDVLGLPYQDTFYISIAVELLTENKQCKGQAIMDVDTFASNVTGHFFNHIHYIQTNQITFTEGYALECTTTSLN